MTLFGAAIIPIIFFLIVGLTRRRFTKPRKRSLDEVIPLVSSRGSLAELERLFHPSFDSELARRIHSKTEWRRAQRNRARRCCALLSAVDDNVTLFQELGRTGVLESDGKLEIALDREDLLSQEIFERATVCLILLKFIRVRVQLCSIIPVYIWPIMGSEISKLCVYAGHNLVLEYRALVEATLSLSQIKGDYYYDNLLCAL